MTPNSQTDKAAAKKLLVDSLAFFKKGSLREAVSGLMDLIARYPASDVADNAYYNLGLIHEKLGQSSKAHSHYQAVIALYPQSDAASFAKDRLEGLQQAADPAAGLFNEAQDLYRKGDVAKSIQTFESVIAQYPDSSLIDNVYFGLGMVNQFHGDKAKAKKLFGTILERWPDSDAANLVRESKR